MAEQLELRDGNPVARVSAPKGDGRDPTILSLEAYHRAAPNHLPPVELDRVGRSALWLFGQLWNCSDVLPGSDEDVVLELTEALGRRHISTYARAVRVLKPAVTAQMELVA